ncbi:hypothetical protein SAY86_001747 [Trapa natans]|uniref:BRCT domain-containing protein n=1 Tax=Trapa natans TaxID=22666 RepID=A0AAN7R434_TRANT|nr:hypothetical protein SAY86_001747 [Trapa natans]
MQKHVAYDLLLPKGSQSCSRGSAVGAHGLNPNRSTSFDPKIPFDHMPLNVDSENTVSMEMKLEKPTIDNDRKGNLEVKANSLRPLLDSAAKVELKVPKLEGNKSSLIFKGKRFCFSEDFPVERRAQIIEWINQGGGEIVEDPAVHFTIDCHGVKPRSCSQSTYISSHWIRSCLEDGCLLDVGSHILYSPLPCQVPFPGFENFRFCISQYEEKDRLLLRNLCYILGAKFIEKLTKKVTHLFCKFRSGPKYEAACKWGIQPITSEWIYECIRQNNLVSPEAFCPREISVQEARLCTMTQFPSQPSQILELRSTADHNPSNDHKRDMGELRGSNSMKKVRLSESNDLSIPCSTGAHVSCPTSHVGASGGEVSKENGNGAEAIPDVAAAIEDLLEQTNKLFPPNHCSSFPQVRPESHMVVGLSKRWMNRTKKNDDNGSPCGDGSGSKYDRFSETQTESQVVGYEEDLSGRQMIIDRVRSQMG